MNCTPRYHQRLARGDLDWPSVHRPGEDAFQPVDGFLESVVAKSRRAKFFAGRHRELEHRRALPQESSLVTRNRIWSGPRWIVSSEGLIVDIVAVWFIVVSFEALRRQPRG